ncbi:hypothetical protein PVK64_09445 [Aliivibrio sp. S4TY2]|uniref:hypothetical protein n=1 Tax=unclassified Aliivibrio TaxID=2645654 RepID=UPI0023798A7E|nr:MULTISPECIES: hypothetical protein [unclassified Aliivibrio]MDD9156411.1 hypothetical protein [Aliivibrio sp. S4TY2]MDD9162341.1 hypothetical protein [Aliivibrio sp. S4TY1]MDD9164119.1 hypothetical protein [Aliivibrio sp. S4MY2]MDD9167908.1 hypothetical protein [Aliivibrio sp. S4MY4]MDD9187427.1 hypothetical protein [Aliivibrio sp. S4MY3]
MLSRHVKNKPNKDKSVEWNCTDFLVSAGTASDVSIARKNGVTDSEIADWTRVRLDLVEAGTVVSELPSVYEYFDLSKSDPEAIVDELNAVEFVKNCRLERSK